MALAMARATAVAMATRDADADARWRWRCAMLVPRLLTLTMLAMLVPMLDARWRRARVMLLLVLR